jgi:hypothetical protein
MNLQRSVSRSRKNGSWVISIALLTSITISDEAYALIGGQTDTSNRFSATVKFNGATPTGDAPDRHEFCSATIVGARAALTAGHCVDDGGTQDGGSGAIDLGDGNGPIAVTCTRHPDYNGVNDVALCQPAAAVTFGGTKYEVVQTDATRISEDSSIVLLGYGCTEKSLGDYGVLNWGGAGLRRKSTNPDHPSGSDPDAALMIADGGVVFCGGDSGSGAFDQDTPATRHVIGIAAVSDIDNKVSRLVQTTDSRIVSWFKSWGDDRGIAICGIHSNAAGCR